MNKREAILAAADHIEAHPDDFDFHSTEHPECGTPGCALGWIWAFSGTSKASNGTTDGAIFLGTPDHDFYDRMRAIRRRWASDAQVCADNLRIYADKYHPESLPDVSAELDRILAKVPA